MFLKKIFPYGMFWILIICSAIKVGIFYYGIYLLNQGISVSFSNFLIDIFNVNWWNVEGLSDFTGDYLIFRQNFLNGVPLYGSEYNGRYLYPPLYLYLINLLAPWTIFSAPIMLICSNIMTGYFIFHLSLEWGATPRASKCMMVLQLLSPINLFYNDLIWQNPGIYTMFIVWAMVKITQGKDTMGMILLGFAISVKQVALFFYPIFLIGILYKKYIQPKINQENTQSVRQYIRLIKWKGLLCYGSLPVLIFFLWSLPYIVLMPKIYFSYLINNYSVNIEYLRSIFGNIVPISVEGQLLGYFPNLAIINPQSYYQANFRASLDVAFAWIGTLVGIPSEIIIWFAILFHLQVFLIGLTGLILIFFIQFLVKRPNLDQKEFYWIMWYNACLVGYTSVLFLEVGIYKYYFICLTPFWALYGNFGPLDYSKWLRKQCLRDQLSGGGSIFHICETFAIQLLLILANKWLAPLFLYLPLFFFSLVKIIKVVRNKIKK